MACASCKAVRHSILEDVRNCILIYVRTFKSDLRCIIEGGEVNLCGVSFLPLLLWLSWCVLQWGGVRVETVDILALVAS